MEIINAESSTFKENGFDEFWLQDEICKKSGDTKTMGFTSTSKGKDSIVWWKN